MNLPDLFSFIPKIAIFLLLLVGGFIMYEISSIFRIKLPKKQKKVLIEDPNTMQPLKFPHVPSTLLKKPPVAAHQPIPHRVLVKRIVGMVLLVVFGGLAYFVFVVNSPAEFFSTFRLFPDRSALPDTVNPRPTETPVPLVEYGAELLLYVETAQDPWMQTTQDELSLLSPGDTIKIAVKTDMEPNEIEITVNGKNIPLSVDKSPLDHPYAKYTIPEDTSEFHIAARVL